MAAALRVVKDSRLASGCCDSKLEYTFSYSSLDITNASYRTSFLIGNELWTQRDQDRLTFLGDAIMDLKHREDALIRKHNQLASIVQTSDSSSKRQKTAELRKANEDVRQKAIVLKRLRRAQAKRPSDRRIQQAAAKAQTNLQLAQARVVRLRVAKARTGRSREQKAIARDLGRLQRDIKKLSRDITQMDEERLLLLRTKQMFFKGGGDDGGGGGGAGQRVLKKKKTGRRRQRVAVRADPLRRM